MANINDRVKDIHTNTFYVNPTHYNGDVVTKDADVMGVSFSEATYKDGIEVPEKLVTVNGATNYHILDAVNLYWDDVKIPWATKITKWKDALVLSSDPDYEYNRPLEVPNEQTSWAKDGIIRESEDVADILNYLIYRTVSIDKMLDEMNSVGLQTPALRLVNNRTDWYSDNGGIRPDDFDADSATQFFDTFSDNRFTVKSVGLKVFLYPYLVSKYWHGPDSDASELNISEDVPLYDSDGVIKPGIVLSDTGWDVQRQIMWNGQGKIREGQDNFDIFQIETISTSTDIRFNSSKRAVLDSFVSKNLELSETRIDGSVNETILATCYLYKLPVVAYKCVSSEKYPYTPYDLLCTLIRYKYNGLNGSNNENYRQINHSTFTPAIDPSYTNVTFGIEIAKTPVEVDVPNPVNGYKGDSKIFNAIVYKGDNTLYDLKLEGKSQTYVRIGGEQVTQTFKNSRGHDVVVNGYLTYLPITPSAADYENEELLHLFKSKIVFEAEFGPTYDALPENNDNPDNILKKSHVHPYFIVKTEGETNATSIIESINTEAYRTIYSETFNDLEANDIYVLYDNPKYGKITYEKSETDEGIKWDYYYWTPTLENVIDELDNDSFRIKLYALMYYPIDDVTTNRLLNPLYAELPLTLKRIEQNKFTTIHGIEPTEGNYVADTVTFKNLEGYSIIDENDNLIINLCDICETEKGSKDFTCEVVGYALEDYSNRTILSTNLFETQLGISYIYDDGTVFPIKTDGDFIAIEKNDLGEYRKTIPACQFLSFDETESVIIDPINLVDGDDKIIDIVSGTNPETNEKFVNLVIKSSTALYPKANGLLVEEGVTNSYVDADKDYFYIVLKVKCERNFNSFNVRSETDENVMYDECETYYALKINRATVQFSDSVNVTTGHVRENIYLQTLLNNADETKFNKYTGKHKWGINHADIHTVELQDTSTVKTSKDILIDNVYFFNIGDEWPWRHRFEEINISGGNASDTYLEPQEVITIDDETKYIHYTTNIGLFTSQLTYLRKKYGPTTENGDDLSYGNAIITPYGDNITIYGNNVMFSRGPVLYIDRLKTVINKQVSYYGSNDVNINFELCVGNDPRYNLSIKSIKDFKIEKTEFDVVPLSRINGEMFIETPQYYYSFGVVAEQVLDVATITQSGHQYIIGCFGFVSTQLGKYYLGDDVQRNNINENITPIVMGGDVIIGNGENIENSFAHFRKQILTQTVTLNGSSVPYEITPNNENGTIEIKISTIYLNQNIQYNTLKIAYEIISDIYKKKELEFMYKKTMWETQNS